MRITILNAFQINNSYKMKKTVLTLVCLFIITSFVFSQNLQIYRNGNLLVNNATLNIIGGTTELIKLPLHVHNISGTTIDVKLKKIYGSLVSGSDNSFCFAGQCYSPSTMVSPNSATITTYATDTTFEADYNANGAGGTSTITYVFFNTANSSDSVSVIVNYTTAVGINDITKSDVYFSEVYPNPASNNVSFSYTLPKQATTAKISICNILGISVADVEISDLSGQKSINTANLKDGIYFYSLIVNDKIFYTRKMIIRH